MSLHDCASGDRNRNRRADEAEEDVGKHVGEPSLALVVDRFESAQKVEQKGDPDNSPDVVGSKLQTSWKGQLWDHREGKEKEG